MGLRIHTTPADKILIAGLVVCSIALFFLMPGWVLRGGMSVEILSRGKPFGSYRLDRDRTIAVPGPRGTTIVRIEANRVRIVSSPCPLKICETMGDRGREGGLLVCMPNQVVVSVGEGRTDGIDAVSR